MGHSGKVQETTSNTSKGLQRILSKFETLGLAGKAAVHQKRALLLKLNLNITSMELRGQENGRNHNGFKGPEEFSEHFEIITSLSNNSCI